MRRLVAKWKERARAREARKLADWQDLMAWMKAHGYRCRACGRWHQFTSECY